MKKPRVKERAHRMASTRKASPSDVTEAQWETWEPLIPPIAEDATPVVSERKEIVHAIFDVLRSGCPWRMLPHDVPNGATVSASVRQWRQDGTWHEVLNILRGEVRQREGREADPSAIIIESQSLTTSAVRGPEKGSDAGTKIWGRKRPLIVDTLGL